MYGLGNKPVSLAVEKNAFTSVYKRAGETKLVDLSIDGKTHPVLIHMVQKHPVTNKISNIEFLMVNLTEKLTTSVPITTKGTSPAVLEGKGTIILPLQEVEIETLPANIPENIPVDISNLTDVGQEIKVKDLVAPPDVTLLSDPELTVVIVGVIPVEETTPPAQQETPGEEEEIKETQASTKEMPESSKQE
jgi:large subunit ribosomal protein L25